MPKLIPTVGVRQRFPFSPATRILLVVLEVDPALEQDAAGADRLRIFRDERALLSEGRLDQSERIRSPPGRVEVSCDQA